MSLVESRDSGLESALASPEVMTRAKPLPPNKKKQRNRAELPISIGKEHQIILSDVQATLIGIKEFKKCRTGNDLDFGKLHQFAKDTLPSFKVETSELQSAEDYIESVGLRRIDKRIKERVEFKDIRDLCNTAREFKEKVLSCYGRLHKTAHAHLYKYCLSFSEVVDSEVPMPIAQKYDEQIADMKKDLQRNFKSFRELRTEYLSKCSPFLPWLENFAEIEQTMTGICDLIINVCNGMKTWVRRDEMYPRDLHNAAMVASHIRATGAKKLTKLRHRKDTLSNEMQRKTGEVDKKRKELKQLRGRRKKFWNSKETVEYKQERIQAALDEKNLEVEKTERQYEKASRRVHPKKYNDEWSVKLLKKTKSELSEVQHDAEKLQEELNACQRQLDRIERDKKSLEDAIYETKIELKEGEVNLKDLEERVSMLEVEIGDLEKEGEESSRKIEEIQRLRDYKLLPESLRRIHFTKKVVLEEESERPLDKALEMVCKEIGEDWKRLYVTLPFNNRRELERKERDVETLEIISPRFDLTLEGRARRGLEKWKLMYRKATVKDLVKALRKIDKGELAENVEDACLG